MGYERQSDFGTPEVRSDTQVTCSIDGREVTVPAGTTVMRAAALIGGSIPKLCATDNLKQFGSCRLCLVEVDGMRGTPASCTTPVAEGMKVHTQTPRLQKLRRGVMELYISDHPLDCLTCSANNDCELQDQAAAVGLRDVRYGYEGENHLGAATDTSNPYFDFDPSKCIACSRCVRACDEVQGTFALTIDGRGFASKVSAGLASDTYLSSECVSCGACVSACPTATLQEKAVKEIGKPERSVVTTCAYCGVGCTFRAEMRGEQLVRMVPWKDGKANRGHSCVKGRFAWGYAQHQERVLNPMIRESIDQPWREVSWDEALAYTASELNRIRLKHGRNALGGITSSRCTNEEAFLVQKLVRAGFGTNNVDTCARVCHSPTGYGLSKTFGTSAGTQDFDSVEDADVILVIGANPTDGHPVFASRMKQRLRQGAKLIVVDPRRTDIVRSPHIAADFHLPLRPGTNVAVLTALAHTIVTEGLVDEAFVRERCDWDEFSHWAEFVAQDRNSPEFLSPVIGVDAETIRGAARLFATGGNGAIYYGLGVTEHSQGSSTVMAIANLAMATGNIGRRGVGVNPLRGQNNVQGACDMGSFPHELSGYRHVSDAATRALFEAEWGVAIDPEPGMRIPNMLDAATDGEFKAIYIQGEDILQSDPDTKHVAAGLADVHGRQLCAARCRRLAAVAGQCRRARWQPDHARRWLCSGARQVRGDRLRADRRAHGTAFSAAAHHWPHPVAIQRRRADPSHRQHRVAPRGRARNASLGCREPRPQDRRLGTSCQPRGRDDAARDRDRPRGAGRGLHHVPPPRDASQCRDHRLFGLGYQLPRIQGDRGADHPVERSQRVAIGLRGAGHAVPPHRKPAFWT